MTRLTHISRMDTLGGIERLLQSFINKADPDFSHALLLTGKKIHPALRPASLSIPIRYSRTAHGIRIPQFLRAPHRNHALSSLHPELISFWGYPTTDHDQMRFPAGAKLIYQEHGSCWDVEITQRKKDFLSRMDGIVCCSFAAQRMLQLRWNCSGPIRVIRNPLLPHALPAHPQPKKLPENRPLVLGTAGRLVPYKATCITLLVLKQLKENGRACRLKIAGAGPLLPALQRKAEQLGIGGEVEFIGTTPDMGTFYKTIDLFLLPSMREPLGLVAVEALAAGCPVVATAVDGIPEAVINGKTGFCIQPDLAVSEYLKLAGPKSGGKFPEMVYDPAADRLRAPLAPDPYELAKAVQKLISDPALYESMSRAAIQTARDDFLFDTYYNALKSALLESV